MSLQTQLSDDMKTAMKARDTHARDTLRMLIAACKNRAVELGRGPQGELSDDEVQALLVTERKRREEAAAGFDDGDRPEQAAAERAEAELIAGYLPQQLSDQEVEALVAGVVEELGTDAGIGPLMKESLARAGGRADGKRINAAVRGALA